MKKKDEQSSSGKRKAKFFFIDIGILTFQTFNVAPSKRGVFTRYYNLVAM